MKYRLVALAGCLAACAIPSAWGDAIPFSSGRFFSDAGEAQAGTYSSPVMLDAVTLGEATFRSEANEFISPADVRVYVEAGADQWRLLTHEEMSEPISPVRYALSRDVGSQSVDSVLSALDGRDLTQLLYTDATSNIRIDVVLAAAVMDDQPGAPDRSPEVMLITSVTNGSARLVPVVAGYVDDPVFAGTTVIADEASTRAGATGMSLVLDGIDAAQPMHIVGFDLSDDFGLDEATSPIGYRIELPARSAGVIAVLGCGRESQVLGLGELVLNDEDEVAAGTLGGGGGGSGNVGQTISTSAGGGYGGASVGFRGSGGGGGGGLPFFPFQFAEEEPITDVPADDSTGDGDEDADETGGDDPSVNPGGTKLRPEDLGGFNLPGDSSPVDERPSLRTPPGETPVPGPTPLVLVLGGVVLGTHRRRRSV